MKRKRYHDDMNIEAFDDALKEKALSGISLRIKEERKNISKRCLKVMGALITALALFIGSVIISPVLAENLIDVPLIGEVVKLFKNNRNLVNSLNESYGNELDIRIKENGYDFHIFYGMKSSKSLILLFKLTTEDGKPIDLGDEKLYMTQLNVECDKRGEIASFPMRSVRQFKDNIGVLSIESGVSMRHVNYAKYEHPLYVSGKLAKSTWGNWDVDEWFVELDRVKIPINEIEAKPEREIIINQEIAIGEQNLRIEKCTVEPIGASIIIDYDESMPIDYNSYNINVSLVDEKGNPLSSEGLIGGDTEKKYDADKERYYYRFTKSIITPYFTDIEELWIDEISTEYLKGPEEIMIDLKDAKVMEYYADEKFFKIEEFEEDENKYEILLKKKVDFDFTVLNRIDAFTVDRRFGSEFKERYDLSSGYTIKPILKGEEVKWKKDGMKRICSEYDSIKVTIAKKVLDLDGKENLEGIALDFTPVRVQDNMKTRIKIYSKQ